MGKKSYFAALFVFLLLLLFLFPVSTGEEFFLVPQRVIDLNDGGAFPVTDDKGTISFTLGDHFGYFTEDMELSYLNLQDFRVAVSDQAFIKYSKVPSILDIQDSVGRGKAVIEKSGYPVIEKDRIVVLSESHISLYDLEGNLLWEKVILSYITSIAVSNGDVLVGFLDGSCKLIGESGEVLLNYRPGGSRIESIYGVALSGDTRTIALISGLDPQRFIILEERKGEYKPVNHFELDYQYRRTVSMNFSSDNNRIFFENPKGINVYDVDARNLDFLEGSGHLVEIFVDEKTGFYSLLVAKDSFGELNILTPSDRIFAMHKIPGQVFYFRKKGDNYYLGSDDKLMFLKMVNE